MDKRILFFALLALAASGCKAPADRIVTGDGEIVIGRLESLGDGTARIAGVTVSVPSAPARVWGRSGSTHYGTVAVSGGTLSVRTPGGTMEMPLNSVSMILWGETTVESRVFDVPARAGWICTHLLVTPGDFITVSSGGRTLTEAGYSEPDGIEEFSSTVSLAPQAVGGSLVMRIGPEGDVIQVGSHWSGNAPAGGELFLAVNTLLEGEGASEGRYTAVVTAGSRPGRGATAIFPGGKHSFSL